MKMKYNLPFSGVFMPNFLRLRILKKSVLNPETGWEGVIMLNIIPVIPTQSTVGWDWIGPVAELVLD